MVPNSRIAPNRTTNPCFIKNTLTHTMVLVIFYLPLSFTPPDYHPYPHPPRISLPPPPAQPSPRICVQSPTHPSYLLSVPSCRSLTILVARRTRLTNPFLLDTCYLCHLFFHFTPLTPNQVFLLREPVYHDPILHPPICGGRVFKQIGATLFTALPHPPLPHVSTKITHLHVIPHEGFSSSVDMLTRLHPPPLQYQQPIPHYMHRKLKDQVFVRFMFVHWAGMFFRVASELLGHKSLRYHILMRMDN